MGDVEAFLAQLLKDRLARGLTGKGVVSDVEATLRQAGVAYRERVQPLEATELKAAARSLQNRTEGDRDA